MALYSFIAREYDRLFPHPEAKTDFVEKYVTTEDANILDLGCATGELLLSLNKPDRILTGIDMDIEMILTAQEKAKGQGANTVRFVQFDMVFYLEYIDVLSHDLLLCFGNSLAYVNGPAGLESFLNDSHRVLKPGGTMIIQILNYDNPSMAGGEFKFPELHTPVIRFQRYYSKGPKGELYFNTRVINPETGEINDDTHQVYLFTSSQIHDLSRKAGFTRCEAYGGYGQEEIMAGDMSRLYVLQK